MGLEEIHSGYVLFSNQSHAVYSLLSHVEPGLMLDVGAAAGIITKLMLRQSPDSRIMAFEPFPGNFPYFDKNIGIDSHVTLHCTAVSDRTGEVSFFVPSVVSGTEPGWENYPGYSSLGYIVNDNAKDSRSTITVPTVRLDDVVSEHVRFCKIDVQGGEPGVLRGAGALIEKHGVDIFYVEFDGDESILSFLQERGYVFYDNTYLLVATQNKPSQDEWKVYRPGALSTGKEAYEAWPRSAPRSFREYCTWLKAQSKYIGYAQTDIVCVHECFLPDFLEAAAQVLREARTCSMEAKN